MARIELAPEVLDDLERFVEHLTVHDVHNRQGRIAELLDSVEILAANPFVGRPLEAGLRELVIGRGSRGYVALYRFVETIDTVFVLAIRSQKEAGYESGRASARRRRRR